MAEITEIVERDGHTIYIYASGAEYDKTDGKLVKPASHTLITKENVTVFKACEEHWGTTLRNQIVESGATIVIRPDSGDPATVVLKCLQILDSKFGSMVNTKGYKILNYVRVIQGDGVNETSIREILKTVNDAGYSTTNVAFGMGGALLQQVNRDTQKFALS